MMIVTIEKNGSCRMYEYIYGTILVVISIGIGIHLWRKRSSLRRLAGMSDCEKNELLDTLAKPFGYRYVPEWDVFSSRVDAWQKQFGYGVIYDRAASYFNMVLETLPVYFDYDGKTWLIQIWKGQYGICTGCFSAPNDTVVLSRWKRLQSALAQWMNRFNCKLFNFVTRSCTDSRDRILYLYFYFPFACRHILRFRRVPGKRW